MSFLFHYSKKKRLQKQLNALYPRKNNPQFLKDILIAEGKYKQLSKHYKNKEQSNKLNVVMRKLNMINFKTRPNTTVSRIFEIPYVNMAMKPNSPIKQLHKNFINGVDEKYISKLILDFVNKTNRLMKRQIQSKYNYKILHGKITKLIGTIHSMIVNKNGTYSINNIENTNVKIGFMNNILYALSRLNTVLAPESIYLISNLHSCNSIEPRNNMFVNCKYTINVSRESSQNYEGNNIIRTSENGVMLTLIGQSLQEFMVLWKYAQQINPNNHKLFTNIYVHQ